MITIFKATGLLLTLMGLGIALLDALGRTRSQEKLEFTRLLHDGKGGIPRSTPGFEKFLAAFPPPNGFSKASVTHTTKDVIQTHDGFPVSITIRYVAANQRMAPVASFADVLAWSRRTKQKWWSFWVGLLGWLVIAAAFVIEASPFASR